LRDYTRRSPVGLNRENVTEMDAEHSGQTYWKGHFGPVATWVVTIGFGVLAWTLWVDPWPWRDPTPPRDRVPDWMIDPSTLRSPADVLTYDAGGFAYSCSECHDLFESPVEPAPVLTQHQEIVLEHGINNRCFNCHHREKRDYFVAHDGSTIDSGDSQGLCAKCHGPVFRDWSHRVHGRTNGYWDTSRGPQRVKKCISCHDPHSPAFPSLPVAPGPNTLRAPAPSKEHGVPRQGAQNPLLYWRRARLENGAGSPAGQAESHSAGSGGQ